MYFCELLQLKADVCVIITWTVNKVNDEILEMNSNISVM